MIWTDQFTCEIALWEAVFAEAIKVQLCWPWLPPPPLSPLLNA
jgi:hypothetical protein